MLKAVVFIAALIGSVCLTASAVVDVELTSNDFSPVDKALECAEVPKRARTELAKSYSRDVFTFIMTIPQEHAVKVVVVNMVGHGCLIVTGEPLAPLPKDKVLVLAPAVGYPEWSWLPKAKYYVIQEMEPQEGGLKRVYRVITLPRSSAPETQEVPQRRGPPARIA